MWHRGKRIAINLALQGGGAHGAFTWGVLDQLLQQESLEFAWISGTSAGAVNAVAMASGLTKGGAKAARATLREVWEAVRRAGVPDLLHVTPFLGLSRSETLRSVTAMMSPYEFNPLGFDPLRRVLKAHIDFERIRAASPVELLIAATDVATGRPRLFRRHELSVEAVLASACLPAFHRAIEIDGRAYWDGAFSANPDIVTLACESPVRDTLIVQLSPAEKTGVPKAVADIAAQVNRITFNQPYLRDIALIRAAQEAGLGWFAGRSGRIGRLKRHRFHLIEAGRFTGPLALDTQSKPDSRLLAYLHSAGRSEAQKWLERNLSGVGRRSTADLK